MWSISIIEQTSSSWTIRINEGDEYISMQTFIYLLIHDHSFRAFYTQVLSDIPFTGFFWENKPMKKANMQTEYECTIHGTDLFEKLHADPIAFKEQLNSPHQIVSFMNLRKDALLIVPKPISNSAYYLHLALFLRKCDQEQIDLFWKNIGQMLEQEINEKPVWLSTSGLGVNWLHARIDKQPKYYKSKSYKLL